MEGAGHAALAGELADVAQVDEHDVVAAVQRERLVRGQGLDRALGGRDQRLTCTVMFCGIAYFSVPERAMVGSGAPVVVKPMPGAKRR